MVYEYLLKNRPGIFALIDPDRSDAESIGKLVSDLCEDGLTAIMIGTSFIATPNFDKIARMVKRYSSRPVILFPGGTSQVTRNADAIFYLSLLSGRNPEYLIGEQVRAAFLIREFKLEPISVGYLLIDSGSYTSVEFTSQTKPLPRTKPEIVCAHALAGQYLGMKMIYLEAGSGGKRSVPIEVIRRVRATISIPLIVGGGISNLPTAQRIIRAGADFIVIGSIIEQNPKQAKRIIKGLKGVK